MTESLLTFFQASTLHYCCNGGNDKEFAWGPVGPHDHHNSSSLSAGKQLKPQVLLIDAGCEWTYYAADITRTIAVGNGGKFTPEAKAIYELVLEMQKVLHDFLLSVFSLKDQGQACMEVLKPGLHWDAAHLLAHRTLVQGFQRLGIFKSQASPNSGSWASEEAILASGQSSAFYPHGLGHSLGLDVHDVPSASKPTVNPTISPNNAAVELGHSSFYDYLRLRVPLAAGMVVVRAIS